MLFLSLFWACACSFVLLLRVFASSEDLKVTPLPPPSTSCSTSSTSTTAATTAAATTTTTTTTTPPTPTPTTTPSLRLLYSSTPSSLLPQVLQNYRRLQIPVTGRTGYWSTIQARTCYSSCFWSTALSSSLPLSGFHLSCTSTSLGAISLPVSFHAAACCQARGSYIVPGANLLGAVLILYTVNRLLQQTLLHKQLPFYGFVFVFLSYSSYVSYSSCSSNSSSSSNSSYSSFSSYSSYSSYFSSALSRAST